jgi:hypothetical protein
MDAFYEEDDRIVGHAADPYHRIDVALRVGLRTPLVRPPRRHRPAGPDTGRGPEWTIQERGFGGA